MKLCPFCAEEIQDAAVRCKHCRSDLVPDVSRQLAAPNLETSAPAPRRGRSVRRAIAGVAALLALVISAPVIARPIIRQLKSGGACEPSNWIEWHAAMTRQCLKPSYVCEHMTTSKLLEDPDVAQSFDGRASRLGEMVGRMRRAYGCTPESGRAFHAEPGPMVTPMFPPNQDAPRSL